MEIENSIQTSHIPKSGHYQELAKLNYIYTLKTLSLRDQFLAYSPYFEKINKKIKAGL
jgi:hypothetical protein